MNVENRDIKIQLDQAEIEIDELQQKISFAEASISKLTQERNEVLLITSLIFYQLITPYNSNNPYVQTKVYPLNQKLYIHSHLKISKKQNKQDQHHNLST